jgi:tRNA nucleotidyltransferase (CCA-adding enzyme)
MKLDIISARAESYRKNAALPTVRTGKLSDDIRRRDFTINTLAMSLLPDSYGMIIDELKGLDDLRRGIIRVLHARSFRDDPTRILRAIRYEARYDFKINRETMSLIPDALPLISDLSAERIRNELELIFDENKAIVILTRLEDLGILRAIHEDLPWNLSITQRMASIDKLSIGKRRMWFWIFWLFDQPAEVIGRLNQRLHFRGETFRKILAASNIYADFGSINNLRPSQIVNHLDRFPLDSIRAIGSVVPHGNVEKNINEYLESLRFVKPKTTGHTLKKLGLRPGPSYRRIIQHLRDAWLDGKLTSEEDETILLHSLVRSLEKGLDIDRAGD